MFAPLLVIAALLLEDVCGGVEVTLTTPDGALITPMPKIDMRQVLLPYGDPRFLGWQASGGSLYQRTCPSELTYSVRAPYFACCPTATSTCSFVDKCEGLYTQVFPGNIAKSCPTACITGRLFWSTADRNPYTYIGCGTTDYFIVQSKDTSGVLEFNPGIATPAPPKTTTSDVTTPVMVPTAPSTTTLDSVTTPVASPGTPTPTTPVPAPAKSTNTGAIIGGAVGGGCVAVGLIVLGLLLFFRRRRDTPPTPNPNQPIQQYARPMSYAQSGSPPPQFSPGQGGFVYSPVSAKDGVDGSGRPWSGAGTAVSEVSGTPAGHATELGGSPVVQQWRR